MVIYHGEIAFNTLKDKLCDYSVMPDYFIGVYCVNLCGLMNYDLEDLTKQLYLANDKYGKPATDTFLCNDVNIEYMLKKIKNDDLLYEYRDH